MFNVVKLGILCFDVTFSNFSHPDSAKKQHLFKFVYEDQHGECHHLDVFKVRCVENKYTKNN